MTVNSEHSAAFRGELIDWYYQSARDLPWRRSSDPYAIWISEVMLQQTRVDQALPFFRRFVEAFPDVEALAAAELEEVLVLWEGLGYYSRARNLHRAARQIVDLHGGRFPEEPITAMSLPGVGEYTAAAVTSIAFGHPTAAVDGNVSRVVARVFGIEDDIKSGRTLKRIRALAQELLAPGDAGTFNQAMMELGATVCTPRGPQCDSCPLAPHCSAHRYQMTDLIPVSKPKRRPPHYAVAVAIVTDAQDRLLLVRRPSERLLGGLWEYPGARVGESESLEEACRRAVRNKLGLDIIPGGLLMSFDHQYSHFGITVHAFECILQSDSRSSPDAVVHRWTARSELGNLPMHKSSRKISDLLASRQVQT
jgi:A/G-specific adenine glycosylase